MEHDHILDVLINRCSLCLAPYNGDEFGEPTTPQRSAHEDLTAAFESHQRRVRVLLDRYFGHITPE